MRIGIVTDIHDEVATLAAALTVLDAEGVDVIVSLGDTSDLHGKQEDVDGVAELLERYGAIGVWGNHDHGLCRDVEDETRSRFLPRTLAYMGTMQPRLSVAGCSFTHVEPFLDTEKIEDLWCFEGRPEEPESLARSFASGDFRVAFIGHFHRWLACNRDGAIRWNGTTPLTFEFGERYLVVVGPLFRGDYAVLDTDRWILEPRKVTPARARP